VLTELKNLVEVRTNDYGAYFSHVEHKIECDNPPYSTLRLHFVKADASGEPLFRDVARMLARYITHFCFTSERRKDLSETERNEMYMKARDLFRKTPNTGQVGELLVYFLLETVLHAPQALKKMAMTTNAKEERKGSDGVHFRWDEHAGVLELIFAESKLWKSFSRALDDAFHSIDAFHDSATKRLEINSFTSGFTALGSDLQEKIISYIEGENATNTRLVQACLIGFDWPEYECLMDERRDAFIKEFESRYRSWAMGVRSSLNAKLLACKHKQLRFELFMVPFTDVEAFRASFLAELTGQK
jgi:HamA